VGLGKDINARYVLYSPPEDNSQETP